LGDHDDKNRASGNCIHSGLTVTRQFVNTAILRLNIFFWQVMSASNAAIATHSRPMTRLSLG